MRLPAQFSIIIEHIGNDQWQWYTTEGNQVDLQGVGTHNSHITAWSDAWEHINMRYNPALLLEG